MATDILAGKTIVLIEDNEFLTTIISKKLANAGAIVFDYTNGLEGLAAIRERGPDLILLDIMLPVMNGYEVLEIMNKEGLIKKHPVVVVSNSGQPVETKRVIELGAKDYLVKADFTPDEVLEKARVILSNQQKTKKQTTPSEAHTTDDTESQPKVFVVEDDPLLRNMLSMKLSKSQCASMFTNDGSEALELAESYEPDVIILDLMLPGKDGFEVLSELKESKSLASAPVIVFSNKSEPKDKLKVTELGAASYHVKAMTDLNDLVKEIKKLAGKL